MSVDARAEKISSATGESPLTRLRAAALIAAVGGGALSVALTVYAGRHNPSLFLVIAFALWVLSPFAGILVADAVSTRWPAAARRALYYVTFAIAIGSVAAYAHRLVSPPRAQAAFVFVVVPPVCWLVGAAGIAAAAGVANRQARR